MGLRVSDAGLIGAGVATGFLLLGAAWPSTTLAGQVCTQSPGQPRACYEDPNSGRRVGGAPNQPEPPPPPDPDRTFMIDHIASSGEFYIITSDGRHLDGQSGAQAAIDSGARLVTGPSGHAVLTLPDGTTFTIGANSEIAVDDFIYEPGAGVRRVTLNFVKGFFRWVTGEITPQYKPLVKMAVGDLGTRGTDFECESDPGGSGYIKLYSGELELTDYDTAVVTTITEGQTVRFENFKVVSP